MQHDDTHVRIRAIMEIIGKPKEYIESKMKEYLEKIKDDENYIIVNQKISDATEDRGVWSIFTEIELVAKGIDNMVAFCIEYMPSSIEILKPEKFEFDERVFTAIVNDIIAKLHRVDMIAKQLGTENNVLKSNMNKLIRNNILVLCELGVNTPEKMSKATGIDLNEIKRFLDQLIQEKRMREENGLYLIL